MSVIATVEDFILNAVIAKLGNNLKKVDTLPGPLNAKLLKQMVQTAPAVYAAFIGNRRKPDIDGVINGAFSVYLVSRNARGLKARRRGGTQEIGIYDMIDQLVPLLDGVTVPSVGSLSMYDIKNMFSLQLELDLGASIYSLHFELPNMSFPPVTDESLLDDFITYTADHSMAPGPDEPAAQDNVTLDQDP